MKMRKKETRHHFTSEMEGRKERIALWIVVIMLFVSIQAASIAEDWIAAGNMADYLNIRPTSTFDMKIGVNVVWIGWEGDGQAFIDMTPEDMEGWISTLHLRHLIAPLGDGIYLLSLFTHL